MGTAQTAYDLYSMFKALPLMGKLVANDAESLQLPRRVDPHAPVAGRTETDHARRWF